MTNLYCLHERNRNPLQRQIAKNNIHCINQPGKKSSTHQRSATDEQNIRQREDDSNNLLFGYKLAFVRFKYGKHQIRANETKNHVNTGQLHPISISKSQCSYRKRKCELVHLKKIFVANYDTGIAEKPGMMSIT